MDRKLPRWIESYKDGYKVTKMDRKLQRWIGSYQDGQEVTKDRKLPRLI